MPVPKNDIAHNLLSDRTLKDTLPDPVHSLRFYHQQVQCRQQMEAEKKEYTLPSLLVTLSNMLQLSQHILDNKQFSRPLAAGERHTFVLLQHKIQELIDLDAPYKRTVILALRMTILLDIVTARHVIEPLRDTDTRLFSRNKIRQQHLIHRDCWQTRELDMASIAPMQALTCRWGGLDASPKEQRAADLITGFSQDEQLMALLANPQLFLYPSFEPLDVDDFCAVGHLPVYPLGMTSAYALNADGLMRTPLAFFLHDAIHTSINKTWMHLEGTGLLASIENRLHFQQLVRGRMPVELKEEHKLERAVELVLFYLFHEIPVTLAEDTMEKRCFLPLFNEICAIRRQARLGYSPTYQAVTDRQALLACAWVYRVYTHCRTGATQPDAWRHKLVTPFVQQELPALLEHQDFIDKHHEALHQHFITEATLNSFLNGNRIYFYGSRSPCASSYPLRALKLEESHNRDVEGRVCNTDLVYLDCLLADKECARMEKKLGVRAPASRPHLLRS